MDDETDQLETAQRSAHNSAVLTAITVLFGIVWLADSSQLPSWIVSVWFVLVIPLNLYLMFMFRRRYRSLLAMHAHDAGDDESRH